MFTKAIKRQVIENDAGEPYLIRWALNTPLGGVKLHHILRSDDDRDCHDHPWSFLSILLRGGYWEHRPDVREGWTQTWIDDPDMVGIAGLVDAGTGCSFCTAGNFRYVDRHGVPYHEESRFGSWAGPHRRIACSVDIRRTVKRWHGAGSILWRPVPSVHRLELPPGRTAWSLVFTGPKVRTWGFHTICGWVPWTTYWQRKQEGC